MRTRRGIDSPVAGARWYEALTAAPLTAEQLAEVEATVPRGAIAGPRCPAAHMAALDSEKR